MYYGDWSAGNTYSSRGGYEGTNQGALRRVLRSIARGNQTSPTESCGISIYDDKTDMVREESYQSGKWWIIQPYRRG